MYVPTQEEKMKIIHSTTWSAGPGCHGGAGVFLYVKDGKLERVEGDPNHPYNQGSLCPRALSLKEYVYHPMRLTHPMRRVGKRGENKWQAISWTEAFDTIERRMREIKDKHGAESMLFIQGTGRDVGSWLLLLSYNYGSPNWLQGGLTGNSCYHPRLGSMKIMQGDYTVPDCGQFLAGRYNDPDFKLPECIVLWGYNPPATCNDGLYGQWIIDCMKRGTKIVHIDPVYSWITCRSEEWLQIRPGTDGALVLGMLNVVISEGLYDKEFVEKWCHGFEELKTRVKDYSPEMVSEITWIPQDKIIRAARLFAKSKPASIQWGVPVDMCAEGFSVCMGIVDLWAITGNVENPGGMVVAKPAFECYPYPMSQEAVLELYGDVMSQEQLGKRIGINEYAITKYFHWRAHPDLVVEQMFSGKPYPVKGAWIAGNNFLVDGANPKRLLEAFDKLDFIVVTELFMTPTAQALADIVLPGATFAEKEGVRAWWTPLNAMNKAIQVEECKSDGEICFELAKRFNPGLRWRTLHDFFDYILKPANVTFEQLSKEFYRFPDKGHKTLPYYRHERGLLRKDGKPGFNTPTGRIELYSTLMKKWGYDPLPHHEEPWMSPYSTPELAEKYPLILCTGGRTIAYFHSEHRMIKSMRTLHPYPEITIHPETAKSLSVNEGDWVWVENHLGRCKRKAQISECVHPRVVTASHGWWFPEKPAEDLFGAWDANVNLLIPHNTQSKYGFGGGQYKSLLCRVYKADGGIPGIYEVSDLNGGGLR